MTHITKIQELETLPPSAKLVYTVLLREDELTQKQLAEETRLASRTVRYATSRLEKADLIEHRVNLQDIRQKLYYLPE